MSETGSDDQARAEIGRRLALTGAPNARDLGGLRTGNGRTVRNGRVFRSGALCALTDRDLLTLEEVGMAQVIDLRGASEVSLFGPDRLPAGGACRHASLPVFDPELTVYAILGGTLDAARAQQVLADGQGRELMIELYRGFVDAAPARVNFGAALNHVADGDRLPTLFHCTAGKDRTGWLAAVLLTLLGVPLDAVVADYLITNERLGDHVQAAVATLCAKQGIRDPGLIEPMIDASPSYLAAAFDEIGRTYGSFDEFLADGLGVSEDTQARLRQDLLH